VNYPFPEPNFRALSAPEHHFNTIVGHEPVKRMLWKMVMAERLPHSILLRGAPGVGKRSMAFALVKLLNGGPGDVSDASPSRVARIIAESDYSEDNQGEYFDLRVIGPSARGAGQIKIEHVREAAAWAHVAPVEARRKVIVIHEADRMNVFSANCLLKVLEEPPACCVIVLTTALPHALLPTIRSRCAPVFLHPVPQEALTEWLMAVYQLEREPAAIAALLGGGSPGRAVAQLSKIKGGGGDEDDLWARVAQGAAEEVYGVGADERLEIAALVDRFYEQGFAAIFAVASALAARPGGLGASLALMTAWYRDLVIRALAGDDSPLIVNRDILDRAPTRHTPRDPAVLARSLQALNEAAGDARRPFMNPHLALEALLLRLGEIRH
jgi:DNA polymerase-3 subunit delta'